MNAALDRERLVKLCGMFDSDHAGERANAAAAADRLVRQAGLRWPDVIRPLLLPSDPNVESQIKFCAACSDLLTPWERGFIASLGKQRRPRLSEKQMAAFRRIVAKCMAGRTA